MSSDDVSAVIWFSDGSSEHIRAASNSALIDLASSRGAVRIELSVGETLRLISGKWVSLS